MQRSSTVKTIIHFGDIHLRAICSKVEVFHKGLHNKIDILADTLERTGGGAALAAPQISLLKQIIVINYHGEYFELVNPEIINGYGERSEYEGCLSLPGFFGKVKRYVKVKVKYQDRTGDSHIIEVENQMARCFQHEIDHLNGILYIDRMSDEFVFNDETNEKIPVKHLLELTKARLYT